MAKTRSEVTLENRNGRPLSNRKEFFENGNLFREGHYSKGQGNWFWDIPIGLVKTFYEDGTIKSEEHYDESGSRNGESKYYSKKGELERVLEYVNDKLEKETNFKTEEIKKAP